MNTSGTTSLTEDPDSVPWDRIVIPVARKAGEILLTIFQSDPTSPGLRRAVEGPNSADQRSSRLIVRELRKATPEIPAISEEAPPQAYDDRRKWHVVWLIDPLDGTKEFVAGRREFTVNLALVLDGKPVAGVVHAPALGETYFGQRGQGSVRISGRDTRQVIHTCSIGSTRVPRVVTSRSHLDDHTRTFLSSVGPHRVKRYGSALKFCRVAEGSADVYPRFGPTMEWDTAAGEVVLESAGGILRDLTGQPLRYNKEALTNPAFVAAGDPTWLDARGRLIDG